jgi:hypothetical protein
MQGNAAGDRTAAEVPYPWDCCVGLALREHRASGQAGIARFGPRQAVATVSGISGEFPAGMAALLRRSGLGLDPLALTAGRPSGPSGGRRSIETGSGRNRGSRYARWDSIRGGGIARRRRELRGPEFHQRCALTTRCKFPHHVPKSACYGRSNLRWRQSALAPGSFKPQSRRRPPSPTPASPPTASL